MKTFKENMSELRDEDLKQIVAGGIGDAFLDMFKGFIAAPIVMAKSVQAIFDPNAREWLKNIRESLDK